MAFFLAAIGSLSANAQELSNLKEKTLLLKNDTTRLDTLSISPSTLSVKFSNGKTVSDSAYTLLPAPGLLIWNDALPTDSITLTYRTLYFDFSKTYQLRDTAMVQPEADYFKAPNTYREYGQENAIFGSTQLDKTGSISRGVGIGNAQDLNVNSSLSLQLNGKLTDSINVLASITDDNIPIQPQGNTAQLQEFDQVYIQLYDSKSKLTAGDFFLKKPLGYFTSYYKRGQGASFSTKLPLKDKSKKIFTETSLAVSRGKFARNIIQGVEGNQGPYRLRGNEGEQFIIILAGTERVFIDGREMERGQENDYIIDYNTAEITFTANQLINKDKRIGVEYQYTAASYVRTMAQTSTGIETEKYTVYVNFYSEQDAKNQSLQQELDDSDRQILANAGDNLQSAIAPSFAQVDEFNNEQILYTLTDSLGYDSVFVRATENDPNLFRINFSEVGQGNGDYIQEGFEGSGRIFTWVAPDTVAGQIVRNGNFAPVRQLISPKRSQMLMGGIDYRFSENTRAKIEGGFSNNDVNTFSEIDNEDNISHGVFAHIEHLQPLKKDSSNTSFLKGRFSLESIGENFQPIEPYRSVEFNRNWNLTPTLQLKNQNILTGSIGYAKKDDIDINYSLNQFNAGSAYSGLKNNLDAQINVDGFDLSFDGSILETEGVEETRFSRHRSRVEKTLWITKLGFEDERENNQRFQPGTDSLAGTSYKFYDWQFYLTNLDTSKVGYKVFYRERTDYANALDDLQQSTLGVHYGAEIALMQNPKNQFKATLSNRELQIKDPELSNEEPENTLLTRIEHTMRLAKNAVTSNMYYELGSGLERRQEFVYLEDPTGQGPYTWIDYNDNGVKELNEFELARPEDGDRYIRVFTPTDTYERAYTNQYSHSVNLNPMGIWIDKDDFRKVLARFSNQTAFRVQRKTRRESGADRINPFLQSVGDSALISQSSSIRNTFFYNRSSSKFGVDYTYANQFSKNPLTSGFEERENLSHLLRIRYNFTSKYGVVLEQEVGSRESSSDVISGRTYKLDYFTLKQTLTYQPGTAFRVSLSGDFTHKENEASLGGETADLIDIGAEARLSKSETGTMFAQFNLINIDYQGESNNSLSYEMLNGLQNGQNLTWGAGVQRNLGKNLQLSLSYNGRKSEDAKAIHTGNVQVRAYF